LQVDPPHEWNCEEQPEEKLSGYEGEEGEVLEEEEVCGDEGQEEREAQGEDDGVEKGSEQRGRRGDGEEGGYAGACWDKRLVCKSQGMV
jgi:hypothetical protein